MLCGPEPRRTHVGSRGGWCSPKCLLQESAALPSSSGAAISHLSPAALGWAMLPFPGGPSGMSLQGSTCPWDLGTPVVPTHRQGRAQLCSGWCWVGSGCLQPLSGEEESQGLEWAEGLHDGWELHVASDSGLKNKPQCRKDWYLTCPVQGPS